MGISSDIARSVAELAVRIGANVKQGQTLVVATELEQQALARAIAAEAYELGARFVDIIYFDHEARRLRLEHAPSETLSYVPEWQSARFQHMVEEQAAYVICYAPQIGLLDGIDRSRIALDPMPRLPAQMGAINSGRINWTYITGATPRWATALFPEDPPDEAMTRLWQEIAAVYRLGTPDPANEWRGRLDQLDRRAAHLNRLALDSIHFAGPRTDLTVGLLNAEWVTSHAHTASGIEYISNIPTEEIFITPDPERAEGTVCASMPLVIDGSVINNLQVTFNSGRVHEIQADENADVLRGRTSVDAGACRLGELALVEQDNPIASRGRLFRHTLLDENAASHLALGAGYARGVAATDLTRVNRSGIHIDFMIGSRDLTVTGITRSGGEVPLMKKGVFL